LRGRIFVAGLGIVSASVACMLTTNFDGIVGTDAGDSGGSEGGADGGSDARFCKSQSHTFCADFDEGSLLLGWENSGPEPGSDEQLDLDASVSPPGSFLALANVNGDGGPSGVVLLKHFPQAITTITLGADMRVDSCPSNAGDLNLLLIFTGASSTQQLVLEAVTGNLFLIQYFPLDGGGQDNTQFKIGTVEMGVWKRVAYTITASSPHLNLSYGDIGGSPSTVDMPLNGPVVTDVNAYVNVGPFRPNQPCIVHYDNVFVDITP
jgi:hypothetical protein